MSLHTSADFKRSWRANDIMWGRLDACRQLIECLVTPDRYDQVWNDQVPSMLTSCPLERPFPNSSPAALAEIREAARSLPETEQEKGSQGNTELRKQRFARFWDALVDAAQAEILDEEVPRIIDGRDSPDRRREIEGL